MKLIKLATLTLATAGTFWVCNAGAETIGVTLDSTPLNVAITVTTNAPDKVSGTASNTTTYVTKTGKITNKQLMTIFQNWATASCLSFDFSGAKIVVGWDSPWKGDVLVVDKTGTNVLFDASTGANPCGGGGGESIKPAGTSVKSAQEGGLSNYAYFYVDYDYETGAYTGTSVDSKPGSYNFTGLYTAKFELYDDYVFLPYTDLSSIGSSNVKFTQKWDKNGDLSTWNLSATGNFPTQGDQYYNDSDRGSAKASIKTSGSGKGGNPYWYQVD